MTELNFFGGKTIPSKAYFYSNVNLVSLSPNICQAVTNAQCFKWPFEFFLTLFRLDFSTQFNLKPVCQNPAWKQT